MTRKYGTRQDVWNEACTMTRGGLTKDKLMLSKTGKIVSKAKSESAKANYAKFGFTKRKEEVVAPPVEEKKSRRGRRKKAVKKAEQNDK